MLQIVGHLPVEAIPPEVHQAAAPSEELFKRRAHPAAAIFRMGAGDHHLVFRQSVHALAVEILIAEEVDWNLHVVEPRPNVRVGLELPSPTTLPAQRAAIPWAHIEQRPEARGEMDAGSVGMDRIQTSIELRMPLQHQVSLIELDQASQIGFKPFGTFDLFQVVGIGQVARIGEQENGAAPGAAGGWSNDEGNMVLHLFTVDTGRVDAAREITGNLKAEVRVPASITKIVVMKMNRAIVARALAPVVNLPAPAPPRHGPGGQIHQFGGRDPTHTRNRVGGHCHRKIPKSDDSRCRGVEDFALHQLSKRVCVPCSAQENGRVDFSVVELHRPREVWRSGRREVDIDATR